MSIVYSSFLNSLQYQYYTKPWYSNIILYLWYSPSISFHCMIAKEEWQKVEGNGEVKLFTSLHKLASFQLFKLQGQLFNKINVVLSCPSQSSWEKSVLQGVSEKTHNKDLRSIQLAIIQSFTALQNIKFEQMVVRLFFCQKDEDKW